MPHYYDEQSGPFEPFPIRVRVRGHEVELLSSSGVFSKDRLDNGTRLLLDTCVLGEGWRVHDLGCGNGVVGCVVKLAEPSCSVLCSDVNPRAVKLARMNAKRLGIELDTVRSDAYEKIDGRFDAILLNPPYVAGREVVFRLLEEASQHLKPGGLLQVVARHQKGGKMIMKRMRELLGNVDDSRKKSGFRLYVAKRYANS